MPKYRRKQKVIEAFQYDGNFMNSKGEYYVPDWAVNALHKGILYHDSEVENTPLYSLYCHTIEGLPLRARVGDYIVKLPDNSLAVCTEKYLNEQYELINESRPRQERLTSYDECTNEILINEEERLLSSKGFITKDEQYKIMQQLKEKAYEYEELVEKDLIKPLPI